MYQTERVFGQRRQSFPSVVNNSNMRNSVGKPPRYTASLKQQEAQKCDESIDLTKTNKFRFEYNYETEQPSVCQTTSPQEPQIIYFDSQRQKVEAFDRIGEAYSTADPNGAQDPLSTSSTHKDQFNPMEVDFCHSV